MKRLTILGVLGALVLLATSGCCSWRPAWASRCCPQQGCVVSDGCCVSDSPCCDGCGGGVPVVAAPCASCGR